VLGGDWLTVVTVVVVTVTVVVQTRKLHSSRQGDIEAWLVCSQCRWRRGHGRSSHQEAKEHAQRSPLSASVKHRLLIWISRDLASVCRTPSCSITLTFASINAQRRANGLRIGGREPLVFTPPRCDTWARTLSHCLHPSTQLHRPLARAAYLSCPNTFSLLRLSARGMRGRLHAPILMPEDTHVAINHLVRRVGRSTWLRLRLVPCFMP
jgi:hypothetical protein